MSDGDSNEIQEERLYKIGEAAAQIGVSAKTIKRWEKANEIPVPNRDRNGNRVYTTADIEHIKTLKPSGRVTNIRPTNNTSKADD